MSNLAHFPDLARAREEAAEWVARIDRGLTTGEREALAAWRANPGNARALAEMSSLWSGMDELEVFAQLCPPPQRRARTRAGLPGPWLRALAASLVLAVLAAGGLYALRASRLPEVTAATAVREHFVTAVGEQRSVVLADGSVIAMNTDSALEVALGEHSRDLRLLRGEAYFSVAHDPARPFRVGAEGRVVQAVGTAFGVRLHVDRAIEVIVTEGRVKLLGRDAPILEQLERGEAAWVGSDERASVSQLDGAALHERMAWRNGMLVFAGEPLGSALEEFARYSTDRIVLEDPALAQLRIGGYFPTGDTEALVGALRDNFGLDVQRRADGVIEVRPGQRSTAGPGGN